MFGWFWWSQCGVGGCSVGFGWLVGSLKENPWVSIFVLGPCQVNKIRGALLVCFWAVSSGSDGFCVALVGFRLVLVGFRAASRNPLGFGMCFVTVPRHEFRSARLVCVSGGSGSCEWGFASGGGVKKSAPGMPNSVFRTRSLFGNSRRK